MPASSVDRGAFRYGDDRATGVAREGASYDSFEGRGGVRGRSRSGARHLLLQERYGRQRGPVEDFRRARCSATMARPPGISMTFVTCSLRGALQVSSHANFYFGVEGSAAG